MKHIASRDNAHFRDLRKLCQSGRERRKAGRIVLDGMHLLESYTDRFGEPDEIVVSESGVEREENAHYLATRAPQHVTVLADGLFAELATVETPSGIMAVASVPKCVRKPDQQSDAVVLDGVQDPGNLGSIMRTAAAAGVRQILLSADCAQAWSPKTLRAAMGAHFSLDIHESADLAGFLAGYHGVSVITALDATDGLYALNLRGAVAWVFGSEGQGVRQALAGMAGRKVRIPMPGDTESLNVAAAAAVCLFEAVRQRQA